MTLSPTYIIFIFPVWRSDIVTIFSYGKVFVFFNLNVRNNTQPQNMKVPRKESMVFLLLIMKQTTTQKWNFLQLSSKSFVELTSKLQQSKQKFDSHVT